MQYRNNINKLFGALVAGLIIFILLYILAVNGFLFVDKNKVGNFLSYAIENMHTGLVNSPGAQLAFEQTETGNQFAIVIPGKVEQLPGVAKVPQVAIEPGTPSQLFDIKLELDQSIISKPQDIGLRVVFTSFGTVATPVNMTFDILDNSGRVIFSEKDNTVVETEKVYVKKLTGFNLLAGSYVLRLTTLYNNNVKDEFRQSFNVVLLKPPFNWQTFWFYGLGLLSIIIVIFLIFTKKQKI